MRASWARIFISAAASLGLRLPFLLFLLSLVALFFALWLALRLCRWLTLLLRLLLLRLPLLRLTLLSLLRLPLLRLALLSLLLRLTLLILLLLRTRWLRR